MGKTSLERKVFIPYSKELQTIWDKIPTDLQNELNDIGRPSGYSGQNVLFFLCLRLMTIRLGDVTFEETRYRVQI